MDIRSSPPSSITSCSVASITEYIDYLPDSSGLYVWYSGWVFRCGVLCVLDWRWVELSSHGSGAESLLRGYLGLWSVSVPQPQHVSGANCRIRIRLKSTASPPTHHAHRRCPISLAARNKEKRYTFLSLNAYY